ncbi:MAG TPA: carbohydrate binding domain-containing protein [Candidatus Omnitrophota bacterium]|nr:carbohydrate binding domain-containing protein [Candidatus Omnitrophota bacterium]
MKRLAICFLLVFLSASAAYAGKGELVVADFNRGEAPNNVGGDYGTWNSSPKDPSQGCYMFAEPDDFKDPKEGYCIRLDYDVQSQSPAFNGFWMKLKGVDLSGYNVLSFWVKGTPDNKFTQRFKLELKDTEGKRAVYPVEGITPEWKEVRINFKSTTSPVNWKKMDELVLIFDDILATYKEGTIFIDQISFGKK